MFFSVIDDKYTGPTLTDGKVTKEFAENLLEHFHKEEKLEKKYVYQVIWDAVEQTWC